MKKISFALLVSAGLVLVCSFGKEKKIKFAGLVRYKISPEILDNRVDTNFVNSTYGKMLNYYYSNGNFRKEFLDGSGKVIRTEIYDKAKNIFYPTIRPAKDTVEYYAPTYDNFEVFVVDESFPVISDTVLGRPCYKTEFLVYDKTDSDVHLGYEYFTNPELSIASKDFSGFKDGGWFLVQKKLQALPMKWVRKNERLKLTFEAIEIKSLTPDDALFHVDSKKPLKKIR